MVMVLLIKRRQWIIYREYCAQTYYLYCEHRQNLSDINICSGHWHTSWSGKEINITSSNNTIGCGEFIEEPIEPIVVDTICMENTGHHSLDGRYIKQNDLHNGYPYYRKQYGGITNPYVYIKYEQKWMIYKELNIPNTYYLECDAKINSIDVRQCNEMWKGEDSTPDNVKTMECSNDNDIGDNLDWVSINEWTPKQKRMIIIGCILVAFLLTVICILCCCVCKSNNNSKKKKKKKS